MEWRKKKFLFVIGPRRKEKKQTRGKLARIRNVAVVALGFFVVIWSIQYEKTKLRRRQAALDILRLQEAAEGYLWEHGGCPEGGLEEIRPAGIKPKQWLEEITDPWGRRYDFTCPGRKHQGSVDISSAGPDRSPFTRDDVAVD